MGDIQNESKKVYESSIKEYEEIKKMDDQTLLNSYEKLLRKGAGPESLRVKWMRKEIMNRLKKVDKIKEQLMILEKIIGEGR